MPMVMREESLEFRGSMAFVDIEFSTPVRNVEAMLNGAGTLSAVKVIGSKVRLAAQCKGNQNCTKATVMVSANTANG